MNIWARLLDCPHSPPFSGPIRHPVTPPGSCQWPGIVTKPSNTHWLGKKKKQKQRKTKKKQPFLNLL